MVCALRILPLFVFVVAGLISAPAHASNIKSRAAAFAIHRKEVGMSESRNINPTTLLMPAWIQAVNFRMVSLWPRFNRSKSRKASYKATNGLRSGKVGKTPMEIVKTAVLRHWLHNPRPRSGLQMNVVAEWFRAAESVRSQAKSSRTAVRSTSSMWSRWMVATVRPVRLCGKSYLF